MVLASATNRNTTMFIMHYTIENGGNSAITLATREYIVYKIVQDFVV